MTRAWRSWWVPAVALVALLGSLAWMLAQGEHVGAWERGVRDDYGHHGSMMGRAGPEPGLGSMMSGPHADRAGGSGEPVKDLAEAADAAAAFATVLDAGATVGEVMQFENGYYAEIIGPDGDLATEVLVDPATGDVQIEYGPARMWNTRYGMMATGATQDARVTAAEAERIAQQWLAARGDLTAGEAETFPGYYTLHTLRDGQVDGMLSVNAITGDVWFHSWHGEFMDMSEAP